MLENTKKNVKVSIKTDYFKNKNQKLALRFDKKKAVQILYGHTE